MAKGKKKATDGDGEQVKAEDVIKVPSSGVLKRLMASKRATTKDVAELTGTYAQEVKNAVKDHNLHKKAFGWVTQLDKMEPETLRTMMDHFEHYYEVTGLKKRADSVMRMPGVDDDEDGDDADDGNVHPFPPQAAQ